MKKLSRNRIILLFIFLSLPLNCFILFLCWLFDPCHTNRVSPSSYQVCISAPDSLGCRSCIGVNYGYRWNHNQSCVENYVDMFSNNTKPHPSPIPIDMEMCHKCEDMYSKYSSLGDMNNIDHSFLIENCTDSNTELPRDPFSTDIKPF
jgi:hypothetical protein